MLVKKNNRYDNLGFYIQNVLAGPLVICDPPGLKNGIHLDPLQPGEIVDLSYYDQESLVRSAALNNAIKHGYVVVLNEQEYEEQLKIAEKRQIEESQQLRNRMVETEVEGNIFEAEQIDLNSAGNPHEGNVSEVLLLQKGGINDPKVWAEAYKSAKERGLVNDPVEFRNLVEAGKINLNNVISSKTGKKISLRSSTPSNVNQVTMTRTSATVSVPEESDSSNLTGTRKSRLSNFSSTGRLSGTAEMGIQITENPSDDYYYEEYNEDNYEEDNYSDIDYQDEDYIDDIDDIEEINLEEEEEIDLEDDSQYYKEVVKNKETDTQKLSTRRNTKAKKPIKPINRIS